jgi:L-ascorbate metabolism protein UlaG (beta-lactamase superfamily)
VGFARDRIDDLAGEANADAEKGGRQGGEKPVVIAASASEAVSVRGESEARNEDDAGGGGIGLRASGGVGFGHTEGAGFQLCGMFDGMEDEVFAGHAREENPAVRQPVEGVKVGFSRERGVGGYDLCRLPAGEGWDTGADAFRGGRCGGGSHPGKLRPREASQFCFGLGGHGSFAKVSPAEKPDKPVRGRRRKILQRLRRERPTNHVGLKPAEGWHKRNFLAEVVWPSLFERRTGRRRTPEFPRLQAGQVALTWIGHASFLLQAPGVNLLIDPNWARWLKVIKRMREPGLELHALPDIDAVLITHAHFDHLDKRTLRKVAAEQPIVVPHNVGRLVHGLGFDRVHELGVWESMQLGPVKVTMTPAHHWGARLLADSHRGFGGFVIEVEGRSIFHCGDSAYFPGFAEIGKRLPVEIALLPIGAYDPPSGREVHMTPEDALRAFVEMGAQTFVPMHYGTFRLSYEPAWEPPSRLIECAGAEGLLERVCFLREGEPRVF